MRILIGVIWTLLIVLAEVAKWYAAKELLRLVKL